MGQDEGDERCDWNALCCQVADAATKELSDCLPVHPKVNLGHDQNWRAVDAVEDASDHSMVVVAVSVGQDAADSEISLLFSMAFVVGVASAVAFQPMAALEMHGLLAELESLP